jgi:hypothetical protein
VKNPRSTTHKLVNALGRKATLIVFATPLLNHTRDFWGYVNLIWRKAWPFKFGTPGIGAETYSNENAWEAMKKGEDFHGLSLQHVLGSDKAEPGVILSPRDQQLKNEYIQFITEKRGPLFLLNPRLYNSLRHMIQDESQLAQKVIRHLIQLLCLRRGMLAPLILPDGTIATPGDDIPPIFVRTIRFKLSEYLQKKGHGIYTKHFPHLFTNSFENQNEHIGHGTIDPKKGTVMNSAVLRTLTYY